MSGKPPTPSGEKVLVAQERPGSLRSTQPKGHRNPKYTAEGGEFEFFHPAWARMACGWCGKMGHVRDVCPVHDGRYPWDQECLEYKRLEWTEGLGGRPAEQEEWEEWNQGGGMLYAGVGSNITGLRPVDNVDFDSALMRHEVSARECKNGGGSFELKGLVAREDVMGDKRYVFGCPRRVISPNVKVATIDSGCSRPMVSIKMVRHMQKNKVPMNLLKFERPCKIETGNGLIQLDLAVQFVLRVPIWGVDARGKPVKMGHMPMPQIATVNAMSPVDYLFANTLALMYGGVWDPRSGRYWLDYPQWRQRVFIQCAYTTHLSVVWPLLMYGPNDEKLFQEEWHGRGPRGHVGSFPLFQQVPWSKEAELLRYDKTRVPNMSGEYKGFWGSTPKDPFAFQADGKAPSTLWQSPRGRQVWRAKSNSTGQERKVPVSNSFAVLGPTSDQPKIEEIFDGPTSSGSHVPSGACTW